jgi:hypothetical protein
MFLAIRDKQICQFKAEIENRKRMLCKKRKNLERNVKENMYLKMVLSDYNNYNNKMLEEKRKKIKFLQNINSYINNLNSDLNTTQKMIDLSNKEQNEILREIQNLRNEIEEIIEPLGDDITD